MLYVLVLLNSYISTSLDLQFRKVYSHIWRRTFRPTTGCEHNRAELPVRNGRICGSGGSFLLWWGQYLWGLATDSLSPTAPPLWGHILHPSSEAADLSLHRGACPPGLHLQRALQPSQILLRGLPSAWLWILCWAPKILYEEHRSTAATWASMQCHPPLQ